MKKTEWYPTVCAPISHPVEVVSGLLTTADGYEVELPSGELVFNGWGKTGSVRLEGDEEKAPPHKLQLTWFSFAENKFYRADAELPIKEISTLIDKGYQSPVDGATKPFDFVNIGLAPSGYLSVWLAGEQVSVEVAHLQGKVVDMDWSAVLESEAITREEYIEQVLSSSVAPEMLNAVMSGSMPTTPWHQEYRKEYNWQCEVFGSANPEGVQITYYNGEREFINMQEGIPAQPSKRRAPAALVLRWNDGATDFTSEVHFDKSEIFEALEQLGPGTAGNPLVLQLLLNNVTNELNIALSNKQYLLPLERAQVRLRKR